MKNIPFDEALRLLDLAYGIHILGEECGPDTKYHLSLDEETFLVIDSENADGLQWHFEFKRDDNATVKIDGERMTLAFCTAATDGIQPTVEVRLLVPADLEALTGGGERSPRMPGAVRAALNYVRTFRPDVDRVVFWGDGRWAYMTDEHRVPAFPPGIDVGILEAAGAAVDAVLPSEPVAFQLEEETGALPSRAQGNPAPDARLEAAVAALERTIAAFSSIDAMLGEFPDHPMCDELEIALGSFKHAGGVLADLRRMSQALSYRKKHHG